MKKEDVLALTKTKGFILSNGDLLCLRFIDPEEVKALKDWIPVSERLPEFMQDVLVTIEWEDDVSSVSIMTYNTLGWHDFPVVAWMPLPDPYKEV